MLCYSLFRVKIKRKMKIPSKIIFDPHKTLKKILKLKSVKFLHQVAERKILNDV